MKSKALWQVFFFVSNEVEVSKQMLDKNYQCCQLSDFPAKFRKSVRFFSLLSGKKYLSVFCPNLINCPEKLKNLSVFQKFSFLSKKYCNIKFFTLKNYSSALTLV